MLFLTRKKGDEILINEGKDIIRVLVEGVDINTGKVNIGIEAPRSVSVDRKEVRERKNNNRGNEQ